jgi:Cu2+-exporting ATPase
MMTLVAVAISTAYFYSAAVVLGLEGKMFFWETATLIDLMLLGHWIEMRSVMGASRALEELAKLMPAEAHRVREDGSLEVVPTSDLRPGDRIRVKSGEKVPADGKIVDGRSSVDESMLTGESKPVKKAAEDEVLRFAAAVEGHREHPIAKGVLRTAKDRGISAPDAKDFEAITGKGGQAAVEGRAIRVPSPGAFRSEGFSEPDGEGDRLAGQGETLAYVVRDETPLGLLALAYAIRPESKEAVEILRSSGIRTLMLTSDNRQTAEWMAREIGLDSVIAEVLPDQKSAKIRELQAEGRIVAMTGDGVNDAPALATADLGIAVGVGTGVAVGTADAILVRSDPRDAAQVVILSKATYRKMVQNLWYAAGYNIVAIPLAAGVLAGIGVILNPAVGAVLMSLSTVVVAINARLLKA